MKQVQSLTFGQCIPEGSPRIPAEGPFSTPSETEPQPDKQKIIRDLPSNTFTAADWNLKQVQLLLQGIRRVDKLDDAYALFFRMFDYSDCRMMALRFYYVRWLLFANREDTHHPPFRTSDENFVFAKVAMLMRSGNMPESVKKLLLELQELH